MAKTKAEKAVIIDKLEDAFKNATSSVFVHFTKVTVADESAMRRSLRASEVSYFVAKKTLIRRALEKLGHKHDELPLEGEVAIAYGGGEDATASARLVYEFGKKLTDKLTILGGIFEGKLVGAGQMQEIATIPSVHSLRGMFLNVINSPIAGLAVALKALADKRGAISTS
jgi:large subunit ribosomal protein L10